MARMMTMAFAALTSWTFLLDRFGAPPSLTRDLSQLECQHLQTEYPVIAAGTTNGDYDKEFKDEIRSTECFDEDGHSIKEWSHINDDCCDDSK